MKLLVAIILTIIIHIQQSYAINNKEKIEKNTQQLQENIYSNLDISTILNLIKTSDTLNNSINEYIKYRKNLNTIKLNGTKNEISEYLMLLSNNLTEKLLNTNTLIIDYFDTYEDLILHDNRALEILLLAMQTYPNLSKFTMVFYDSVSKGFFESISFEIKGNEIYLTGSFERLSSYFKHFFENKSNENIHKINMTLNRNLNLGYFSSDIYYISIYLIKYFPNLKIMQINDYAEAYIKSKDFFSDENVQNYFFNNENFKSKAFFVIQNENVKKYRKN